MQPFSQGSVLGVTDFGPVAGSPLIPPIFLTSYFILFLILLSGLYIYFHHKKKPVLLWHKLRLLVLIALALKIVAIVGTGLVIGYWLIPTPNVSETTPSKLESAFSPTHRIEIIFDRPLNRGDLEKSITPEIPGRWAFEDSLYTTHLYRKLVFYPTFSLRPNTTYTVKLKNIRNLIKISRPYDFQFEFTTQNAPIVQKVEPEGQATDVTTGSEIKITLDKPNEFISEFNFYFDPPVLFDITEDSAKTVYTIKPKAPLKQGTKYSLRITKSNVVLNLEDGSVSDRNRTDQDFISSFTTVQAPGISSFKPNQNNAALDSEIVIIFSHIMARKSVQDNFSLSPKINSGNFNWIDDSTLSFKPGKLASDTEYQVTIKKGAKSVEGGQLEQDLVKTFRTIGPVKITSFEPRNGLAAINTRSPIEINFDQEVDHPSAESKFSISPNILGNFSWNANTLIFSPSESFQFNSTYTVTIDSGIKSISGIASREKFQTSFTTQNASTKLDVPVYLQKYTLSCEIASLRMALNFKGASVSEDDLIPQVGLDPTPHNGNIWGNPHNGFVGNIKGTQMVDGYGVYWGPIAKAARSYRDAREFTGWNIGDLTREISAGNPVIIWVYSHFGTPTSWNTPDGTNIYAVRDEHAVVAVGYIGPSDNPTQVIINDPLSGQVYWSRASFDKKWNIFGRSGVVVN